MVMQHKNVRIHDTERSHRNLQADYRPTLTSNNPLRYLEQSTEGSKSG